MADSAEKNTRVWAMQGFGGGLVSNYPAHALDGDQSPDAENFDPSVRWILKKRLGTSNFSGDLTGTLCRGLHMWAFEDGTAGLVAKDGTSVYDIAAGNWSTALAGFSPAAGDDVFFSVFKNVLIATSSAYAAPVKWTGSGAFAALGGSPPSAMLSCVHKGRLWLLRTSADPSRYYASAVNNHEDWSTADNYFNDYVNPGDGQIINGCASDGDVLYISKQAKSNYEGGLYAVFGGGPMDIQVRRIAFFGAVNPRCIVPTQNFVVVATPTGIYGLSGTQLVFLSDAVNDQWTSLTDAQRGVAALGAYKDQVWLSYPASGSTNTKVLVLDVVTKRWSRYAFGASNIVPALFTVHPDGSLYGASTGSTVRVIKYNTGATDIGSTAITHYWNTPNLDYGQWYSDKKPKSFRLHAKNQSVTWTLTHKINDSDSGDSVTMAGASEGPVKLFDARTADAYGRFIQYKISEADTSTQGEAYGIETEAEIQPRSR